MLTAFIFLVYNLDLDDQSKTFQFAVRKNDWKLIWGQTKEYILNLRIMTFFLYTYSGARLCTTLVRILVKDSFLQRERKEKLKAYLIIP